MNIIAVITFSSFMGIVFAGFQQCLHLANSTSDVITRDDNNYTFKNYQFNIRNMIYPFGYVFVKSTADVQKTVHCARKHNIHISIMCGKHSFEKYSYGSNNSWIIDMSLLTTIKINQETGVAAVEAGNRLKRINEYLWKSGKFGIPVGSCPSVGIAGFALGGGFGLNSRKFGLLIDHTVGFEIVTAKGNMRRVTQNTDKDLFWALRGAGAGNFGVVTKFYFKVFDASNVFIWILKKYNFSMFYDVFTVWQKWIASNVSKSVTSNLVKDVMFSTTFNVTFVINNQKTADSETQLYLIRQQFPNITDADIFRGSYMDLLSMIYTPYFSVDTTARFYFRSKGFFVSKILNHIEIELFVKCIRPFIGFIIEMYGGAINQRKRTETAFVHRTSLYVIQLRFFLHLQTNTSAHESIKLGEHYGLKLNHLIKKLKFMSNGEHYQNYVDNDLHNWFQLYYRENSDRLKQIKRRIDPTNFFRYNQSILLM